MTRPFIKLEAELLTAMDRVPRPARRFCVFGSGVMYLHGIREQIGDVDLFVSPPLWGVLSATPGWTYQRPAPFDPPILELADVGEGVPAHAFSHWKQRGFPIDVPALLDDPRTVQGWPCQSLQQLCIWKASIAHHSTRPRDWDDVATIAKFLSERQGG